jgi:uncharacterized ubiquitin-like protein YukD
MGYTDLSSFGAEIDSSKFFDDPDLYLLSASIHATLSDKLINGTGGNLIVPNVNINTATTIRLVFTDVTYVEINETKALLQALEEIGLTDFGNINISPANLFGDGVDIDVLLASASMQATISDTLLDGALDDSAANGSGSLIVPNYYREAITVGLAGATQIEKAELKNLILALKTVDVGDFSGAIPASTITSLGDAELDVILESGSMHVTIDNMIWGNSNINTLIPDYAEGLALTDLLYNMTDIIIKAEIKAFIKAANTASNTSDITNISFDVAAIQGMTPEQRDIVLDSMIVRNILTAEIEATPFYVANPSNYEQNNTSYFLTKQGIKTILGI